MTLRDKRNIQVTVYLQKNPKHEVYVIYWQFY